MQTIFDKPFPLVLEAVSELDFKQLIEYFELNYLKIQDAASEYGVIMFKGFKNITEE